MSTDEENRKLLVEMQMEASVEDVQNWLAPAQEMIDTIAEMVKE